ncbi:hypothetical protein GE376_13345 [Bacillus cereus]|uniref:hypothetical protein n=1 Tax=Bacillus cereus TaxID=1396 RepID=UPI0012929BFC|nr:hypothetical protein [Bacillus cereus]QFY00210.1 hypothetical protein GE376_13345 [Bacillus cereus]
MDIGVPIDVKKFIDKEVSKGVRRQIVPLIQQAYELVDASIKDISFLQWALGKKHIGYLDNIAAQFTLYEAANKGILKDITTQIVPNKNKSAYHVELQTENVVITINRVQSKDKTARKAMYRSLLQRDNQYYINFDKQEIIEEPGYLELTHHQINRRVAFVNLGVPDGSGKWFSCIDLTKELHLVGTSEEDKQKNEISREQLVRFKNFAQGVHENGGKN